jgi:endonuclease/exonuclease/phosphatase family metal-dependent hydrolase
MDSQKSPHVKISRLFFTSLVFLASNLSGLCAEIDTFRVATWNIKNFGPSLQANPERLQNIRNVLREVNPDVIGLQEVADRESLEMVFDPTNWIIFLDDDSSDSQDLALVIKRNIQLTPLIDNMNADDEDFLFSDIKQDTWFPKRRDVLFCQVSIKNQEQKLTLLVVHAKSRVDGRQKTNSRREGAARLLCEAIRQHFKDSAILLMGDFNDSPDDRSMNILETGNPHSPAEMENVPGDFLINLTEPLWVQGQLSFPGKNWRIKNRVIENKDPVARQKNFDERNNEGSKGGNLFDQILISPSLLPCVVPDSIKICNLPVAAQGGRDSRASDHLPVSVDLNLACSYK